MQIKARPIAAAILALTCAAPMSFAQPERPAERSSARMFSDEQRQEFAQRMIEQRRAQLEAELAKLDEAQQRLDAGDSIEDIRADLGFDDFAAREGRRGMRPERPGFRGERGPRGLRGDRAPRGHDELMGIIRDIDPRGARHLEDLQRRNPKRFREAMEKRQPDLLQMEKDRDEHPELFALKQTKVKTEREMFQTVREHIHSGGSADDELRDKLRPLVETQVRADIAIKAYQIDRMEQKLAEARTKVADSEANPDDAVNERIEKVIERVSKFRERIGGFRPDAIREPE